MFKSKEDILDGMYRIFARRGYAASMAELAKEVDLKASSLYSHFESKDQIVFLTAQREITRYFENLDRAIGAAEATTCLGQLKQLLFFTVDNFADRERLHFWQHLLAIPDDQLQQRCRERIRVEAEFVAPAITQLSLEGTARGEIRPELTEQMAFLFNTMLLGMVESLLIFDWPPAEAQARAAAIWDVFQRGTSLDSAITPE